MTGITVIKPDVVTDVTLLATDVPEADYGVYAAGTTYTAAARVIVLSNHAVYESLQAGNLGKDPLTNATWWVKVKPTNRWGCLDAGNTTVTAQAGSFFYRIRPASPINSVFILGVVNCTSVRIRQVHDTLGTIYDTTTAQNPLPINANWYDWYFGGRRTSSQTIKFDLLAYPDCEVRVDFVGGSAMSVGTLAVGYQQVFGEGISYGAKVGIVDFSGKTTNTFGVTQFVVRDFAKKASFLIPVKNEFIDGVQEYLASLRATPALYIGSTNYECTIVFGTYDDFDIVISRPTVSDCSINLKGIT